MIDIHAHILHGLDDGPATLPESAAMLEIARRSGTTDIVASPHASVEFRFDPELVAGRLEELKAAAPEGPSIHLGCDLHLTYDNIREALARPERYTINQRGYLLVEFSDLLIAHGIEEVFARMRRAGITPVVTHPERNWLLQQRWEQLEAWVSAGCTLQVTAQSLFGRFGREAAAFARRLLDRNLVHFIASDAHDPEDRTPRLDLAWRWVQRRYGRERAEALMLLNPRAALEGGPVQIPPAGRRRRWFALPWRGLRGSG